jgi:toxin ParE1/3/4
MVEIEFSEAAEFDRLEILSYLAATAGILIANDYDTDFKEWLKLLRHRPECGSPRGRLGRNIRLYVVYPYVSLYTYDPDQDLIRILRIVHGKRRITAKILKDTVH